MPPTGRGRHRTFRGTIRTAAERGWSRWNASRSPGSRGHLHCPYGWLPGRASGDQGWAGAGDALRDPPRLLPGFGDATDMPGTMSQAGLAGVPGVTPGCAGRLVRAGRNRYPAAGRG